MSTPGGTPPTRVFFVHVMKTGGTSVLYHALRAIDRDAVWGPVFGEGPTGALHERLDRYTNVRRIWAMGDWQLRATQLFMGHYPWCATELVDPTVITATVLREPVERTVSYLRHCKQRHAAHADLPLEQIYEDAWHFPRFVANHQTKIMSLRLDEVLARPDPVPPRADAAEIVRSLLTEGGMAPGAFMYEAVAPPLAWPTPMDDARLGAALANLEAVAVLGVHEDHDEWLTRLSERAGWPDPGTAKRHNVSDPGDVPASLRRRIEEENALDVALYERAREIVAQQRRA